MSLEKIETKKNFIPLKKPFKYALASMTELPYVLVTVTENNIIGIGESSPAPDVTGETQESVINIINFIKPLIIGKPVENKKDIENILKILDAYVSNNQAAKSGLEMALFDLLGKKKNLPVYKILNGKNKKEIKLQKTFGFLNENNLENEVKESIAEAKSLGAEIIKYKVGLNKKYDLDLVKFIRKYNPKIKIVLDVNQGWKNFKKASPMFSALKKYNISWIEQPVLAYDYEGSAALRKKYKIPVMIDEGLKTISDCKLIKIKKAANLVNIKITKVGGFLKAKEIIDFCDKNKIKYMLGDMVHSNIATAANLHLATLGNFVSYDIDNSRVKEDVASGLQKNNLIYKIPQDPGLGVSIKL